MLNKISVRKFSEEFYSTISKALGTNDITRIAVDNNSLVLLNDKIYTTMIDSAKLDVRITHNILDEDDVILSIDKLDFDCSDSIDNIYYTASIHLERMSKDYFKNININMVNSKTRDYYIYYLKLKMCDTYEDQIQLLKRETVDNKLY